MGHPAAPTPLRGREDDAGGTEALVPAIELIDTRDRDWQIKIWGDTIAPTCASAAGLCWARA